jgi:DNA primase large subunit
LRDIEQARSRGLKPDEFDKHILDSVKKHIPDSLESREGHRKDLVSHHILRLAFCNSEDKRRQFLDGEKALFKARLSRLSASQVRGGL